MRVVLVSKRKPLPKQRNYELLLKRRTNNPVLVCQKSVQILLKPETMHVLNVQDMITSVSPVVEVEKTESVGFHNDSAKSESVMDKEACQLLQVQHLSARLFMATAVAI